MDREKTEIDFVITWVDGQDEAWRRQRAEYSVGNGEDNGENRYRDWGLLRYWFRGVEQFAPWVRKIHFITWGHLPAWLDAEHPKLHIVRHEDYIPKEFLPVFNCNVLEIYMHRIEGLAEQFVYFNDDVFLLRRVEAEDFFRGGRPCDMLAFQPVVANPLNPVMSHMYLNNMLVLCKYFEKRKSLLEHPGDYFHLGYPPLYFFYNALELCFPLYTGLYTVHGPAPFRRETFEELWEKEGETLTRMSCNRFRSETDVTQYLFREWQKLTGRFCPKNVQKNLTYMEIGEDNGKLVHRIMHPKTNILCINDCQSIQEEKRVRRELQEAFEYILPDVSSYERQMT